MSGIERAVAALLLAGAVAGAAALPRLAAGPDSGAPLAGFASSRATTVVDAAPLPTPKPKVVSAAVLHALRAHILVVAHPRITAPPQPAQPAPHVPTIAPDPPVTPTPPAPVVTPAPPAPATPAVSLTPTPLPGLGLGHGHAKGHQKIADETTPIEVTQVQAQPTDNGNGNGKSNGHGNGKGA